MELDAGSLSALLERWPVARLATVTPAGEPHVLPVVFVGEGGCIYSPVDAKPKTGSKLARVRNVEAHGRASLLLDHYADDWSQLWWVRVDGAAWVEREDTGLLTRIRERLRRKYAQYETLAPYSGEPTLLALRRDRVRAWSSSGELPVTSR